MPLNLVNALYRRIVRTICDDLSKLILSGDCKHLFLRAMHGVSEHAGMAISKAVIMILKQADSSMQTMLISSVQVGRC